MNWTDLLAAIALVFIIEGLLPFFNPKAYKNMVQQMADFPESILRNFGLVLMVIGAISLYLIRG